MPALRFQKNGCFHSALNNYIAATKIDPAIRGIQSKLYFNAGLMCKYPGNIDEAIKFLDKAIDGDGEYYKAFVLRGQCYEFFKDFGHAIEDYDAALKIIPDSEVQKSRQNAKWNLKSQAINSGYYTLLGVGFEATKSEIRAAAKRRNRLFHTDKNGEVNKDEVAALNEKVKQVIEAQKILQLCADYE